MLNFMSVGNTGAERSDDLFWGLAPLAVINKKERKKVMQLMCLVLDVYSIRIIRFGKYCTV